MGFARSLHTPDRLEAAKSVAAKFVSGREDDNIGVVVFAGESLTGVPMTVDRSQLLGYINSINMNMLEDGTAIGDGIATSLNRLKEGKAKSKSIILLTDGSNNTGVVTPLDATRVAQELGVKMVCMLIVCRRWRHGIVRTTVYRSSSSRATKAKASHAQSI